MRDIAIDLAIELTIYKAIDRATDVVWQAPVWRGETCCGVGIQLSRRFVRAVYVISVYVEDDCKKRTRPGDVERLEQRSRPHLTQVHQ